MANEIKHPYGYLKTAEWSAIEGVPATYNLETVLRKILNEHEDTTRLWRPKKGSPIRRGIVEHEDSQNGLVGELIAYEEGKDASTVTTGEGMKTGSTRPPRTKNGVSREYVEHRLFFLISEDKVGVMQSAGLRSKALAEHITWLLVHQSKIAKSGRFHLRDQISDNAMELVDKFGVKEIHLGADFNELLQKREADDSSGLMDFTAGIFGRKLRNETSAKFASFKDYATSGLKARVSVSATAKAGDQSRELLKTIAHGMADDLADVSFVLGDDSKLDGRKIVTRGKMTVQYFNGRPAVTQVYDGLRALIDGKLSDDEEFD